MKNVILLLLLGYSISGFSQISVDFCWPGTSISFESTQHYKHVKIDTNKIWYITKPNKDILFLPSNRPYLGEWAIITDTNDYYPNSIQSSFQFKIYLGYCNDYNFHFEHKYDFEENKDGGIIETSYDNGQTWNNILFDTLIQNSLIELYNVYSLTDTISSYNNQPGFTGLQENIDDVSIGFYSNEDMWGDTMLLRFTISSDTSDTQNEGWMLDEFSFWGGGTYIDEVLNSILIEIVSNSNNNILEIKSEQERITEVEIISIIGEKLLIKSNYNISNIDISSLNTGIYLILCKTNNSNFWHSKFIKL